MSSEAVAGTAQIAPLRARSKGLNRGALVYLVVVTLATLAAASPAVGNIGLGTHGWPTFLVLAAGAAISQIFVVFTPRDQSYHASIAFIVAAALLLPPELVVLMGIVQHVPEWLRQRYPWYIQTFNICNYTLSGLAAWGVSRLVHGQPEAFGDVRWAIAAVAACVVFVSVNHTLLAAMLYLARGHNLRATGLFTVESLTTDGILTALGVTLAGFWHWNHWLAPIGLLPLLLAHRALGVPALREQARTDAKTGLLNPRAFTEAFDHELARALRFGRPLSVIVADIDHLREINNTFGHLAGDAALVSIANVIREQLRDYDVPSRFGGEEFAILLPETRYVEALEIADRLRSAIAEHAVRVEATGKSIHVTISIGVASVPSHGIDAATLLHRADIALYSAKTAGRNRVVGGDDVVSEREGPAGVAVDGRVRSTHHGLTPESAAACAPVGFGSDRPLELIAAPRGRPATASATDVAPSWRRISFALRGLVTVVGVAGLAAGVAGTLLGGSDDLIGILAVVALVAAGQALAIESQHGSISVGAVGALMAGAAFGFRAMLGIAVAMAAVEWSARRSAWYQVVFNVGALSLAGLAGAGVFSVAHVADSRLLELMLAVVAGAAYCAVNTGLLAATVALAEGERVVTLWRERYSWLAWHYVAYGLVAGVLDLAYQSAGLYALVVAAVPVLVLRRTQAAYLRRATESTSRLRAAAETIQHQNSSLVEANRELRKRSSEALESLSATVDARDAYTAGHSRRVRDLSLELGRELGLTDAELDVLDHAALFHDIGKLAVPDEILLKPSTLDLREWEIMRRHPEESARIVGRLGFLAESVPAIRHHHERYDGGGYPDGLGADEIPLGARIIQVADTVDAMLSPRTYRRAHNLDETLTELARVSGTQLCPLCVVAATRHLLAEQAKTAELTVVG